MPFLFQRVDLPGARTGGLPPIGGSPSRGARIFPKKKHTNYKLQHKTEEPNWKTINYNLVQLIRIEEHLKTMETSPRKNN